ncbi:uncharacterized protein [Littorina saxatilis]|uniref:C1q domain-containing protein n=1 Tax=Littorina saxatilis TaxID=31220 RepID=A0AAN9C373_9CAEN
MMSKIVCFCSLLLAVTHGMQFTITPATFVPGVTSSVNMRCNVLNSGSELTQLLLIQLDVIDRGNVVPVVTFTPGGGSQVSEVGLAAKVKVDGQENQFQNINGSYLSVTFPFPAVGVSGNYTCVVSGLSVNGLLTRYTQDAALNVGAVDELPRFMTAHVVELRTLIETLKNNKIALTTEAAQLRQQEQNISAELSLLETEYTTLTTEMTALRSRASQLSSLLNDPIADLDHLSSVRPGMKVAFHAAMSSLGATTAVLSTPLIFDHVVTNEGQGYSPITGAFRAPVTGTYTFTVSVQAGSGQRDSELSIMMGKTILQTMHMSDDIDYQHSTTTTIAHVPAGSEVTCEFTWLKGLPGYVGSTQANAPYVTAFTGYILW